MNRRLILTVLLLFLVPGFRLDAVETLQNGDTNDDGSRDVSDAVYLLNWLFLGGPAPAPGTCDIASCERGNLVILENGDTNGEASRDLSDAVYLLNWLFLGGAAPSPLCFCAEEPSRCAEGCEEDRCVPAGPDSFVCTTDLETCEDVEALYEFLTLDFGRLCAPEDGCHIVLGHCGFGLGGCYYAVSTRVTQEDLDALGVRFQEVQGLTECARGVCDCARPPDRASCMEEMCEFELGPR